MLYNLKILFTSSLKFLSSLYLSSAFQLNVGCFIMCPPYLGSTFCVFSALATAMAYFTALVASATACTTASLAFVCLLAIICICTLSVYVCLYETFYSLHHVVFLALVKIMLVDVYMYIYCYVHESKSECAFTCVHDYIYSDSAL